MSLTTSSGAVSSPMKENLDSTEVGGEGDPSSCGPDRSYDEGDETGQGEPMSQSPPQSSGRGSEETDSILCDGREVEVCPAPPNEKKSKKKSSHYSSKGINVRKCQVQLYNERYSWCTAEPREHTQQSTQLCCAPAGTECPDLNSYKTATKVW